MTGNVASLLRLLSFILSLALLVGAQSQLATISGVITDTSGSAIPGAVVTAQNPSTGRVTTAQSNATGYFLLRELPIGAYVVNVEAQGFRAYKRENLTLTTGQALTLDVRLEVGALTETVVVSDEAPLLETRTSDTAQLVEGRSVQDMPLGDRRTMNIISMTGAAVFVNYDSGGKPNFSLAGGRTQSQNFYMDGGTIQNMRLGIGQVDTDPPVETVAEVKVLQNNYSAEFGGSAGGVIVATTKSGTNQIKGALYEFLRNDKLDAANFFAPFQDGEKVRPPLRYNIFGGTVGGPVFIPKFYDGRNKTFFFFSYEGSRRIEGFSTQLTVPTLLQRGGDFSQTLTTAGALIPIFDPESNVTTGNTTRRTQFANNIIPTSRIDPVGTALMPMYPLPNQAPANLAGANNFNTNFSRILTRDAFLVKGDHTFSEKDRVSFRYMYNSDNLDFTQILGDLAASNDVQALRHQNFYYATYTRVISPSTVNEFRFTFGDRINHTLSYGLGGNWPSRLGITGVPEDAFPRFNVAGMAALGAGNQERRQFPIRQFQWIDNISFNFGRHTVKAGFEYRRSINQEVDRPGVSGVFGFSPLSTGQPGAAASGFGLASVLAGAPLTFSARETLFLDRYSDYIAWFVQDEWNATRTLTLNYGVRWETDTPITDRNQRMNGIDLQAINPVSGTPGVVRFMGVDGFRLKPYNTDWNNFGPRFGFAWRPFGSDKTVIRGGAGVFFAHPFDAGAPASATLGFEQSAAINSPDNGVTVPFFMRNGVPPFQLNSPTLDASFGAVPFGTNPRQAISGYEENRRTGYSMQWNFTIQRQLPKNILIEGAYLANASRKLPSSSMSINQVLPELLTPQSNFRDRPYPQFTNVTLLLPTLGVSNYHAMMLRAEKRFTSGWNFLSTYTWSKFLNNTNEGGAALGQTGGTYSNFYNRRADYGFSENDVPHRVTLSSVYELPFGKGKRFLTTNPLRHVVGGWGLGGIMNWQAAAPFTVTTQANTVFSAIGSLRADIARDPNLSSDQRSLGRWFDTEAF
ncbi:MAG: carboxypeptidase regulatory-like domain-containing protein, partial [Bryobacterales bacterium]|nr:carboxypeptidase regulatory-like domain-containing protein [Bryobacterales bacterium]